ncbi:MAG: alanine/ornithine racemase family PLP-dependent enzyme [Desulfobulbaceae bacterium]|nr:alanine/ornithine racemase family PLP-dependent enzyme [Candidatus Kapabacteria bacterium]MBS4000722.1 alanine/ornithine racemase family PLP-dependent enzyme [Desulfobulbaceae bacterium]MBS4001309.1 alanine/ornithine racemase family PLP-dependent enzyme [Desulfobulbaceae bacterium]
MAYVTLDSKKLKHNFDYLEKLFNKNGIQWSVVTKMLCGIKDYLAELLKLDIKQVCDSRISNLKMVKSINPEIETVYIKPPASNVVQSVIKYADISMNTQIETIRLLSEEAQKQQKTHKIIIMIELGELREGVMGDDFVNFYSNVFKLKNIEVVGIGTNLSCLYGVLPNPDKLIQLSLYKQLIEAKFNRALPFVSGGSSVTIPLIFQKLLPKGINHFRVGETLFLGTDVYNDKPLNKMNNDVFRLYAEIIELIEKPVVPMGDFGTNVDGHSFEFNQDLVGKKSYRAIIDIGLLDVDERHITPIDPDMSFVGASSDMLVIDLGDNENKYKVGDFLQFKMDYMGTLRIINSKYIDKKII